MASSLQQLLQRSRQGRVDAGNLPAAPILQPVARSGGRYSVAVPQAPATNKFLQLGNALSKINPTLRDYTAGLERRDQLLMQEGYLDYQSDPIEAEKRLKEELEAGQLAFKSKQDGLVQKLRRAVEKGQIDPGANSVRLLGAMQARAEAMANSAYRDVLMGEADKVTDPETFLDETSKTFLNQKGFENPIVKQHALKAMERINNEFRNKVRDRLASVELEQDKLNYAAMGAGLIDKLIETKGDFDGNQPLLDWINHTAGLFPGSKSYVFETVIKTKILNALDEVVIDPVTQLPTPALTPQDALTLLNKLEKWQLSPENPGATFSGGQVAASIVRFKSEVKGKMTALATKRRAMEEENLSIFVGEWVEKFASAHGSAGTADPKDLNSAIQEVSRRLPPHQRADAIRLLRTSFKAWTEEGAKGNTAMDIAAGIMERDILQGKDLQAADDALNDPAIYGKMKNDNVTRLRRLLDSERNFDDNVWKKQFVVEHMRSRRQYISGERKIHDPQGIVEKRLGPEAAKPNNYFKDKWEEDEWEKFVEQMGGVAAAGAAMKREANRYHVILRKHLKKEYENLEIVAGTTPEEAYIQIISDTGTKTPPVAGVPPPAAPAANVFEQAFAEWERGLPSNMLPPATP